MVKGINQSVGIAQMIGDVIYIIQDYHKLHHPFTAISTMFQNDV